MQKDKEVELAQISIMAQIAGAQASVLAEALKSANIDIVGGEPVFFDKLMNAVTQAKTIDGLVNKSNVLSDLKANLLDGENGNIIEKVKGLVNQIGLSSDDVKNLSIAALLLKMNDSTDDKGMKGVINRLMNAAWESGIAQKPASLLGL